MNSRCGGNSIGLKTKLRKNALIPIIRNLEFDGNDNFFRFMHCLNAPSQISYRHDGNLTSSSLEQFAKAYFSIIVIRDFTWFKDVT